LKDLGYTLVDRLVDVADYGVAQHRKRVIVIASQNKKYSSFPHPTHTNPENLEITKELENWLTARDIISKYPPVEAGENGEQDGKYRNHIAPKTSAKIVNLIQKIPVDGGSRTDLPKEDWLKCHVFHNGHTDVYGRVRWDRPSNTITTGCRQPSKGRFIHPEQHRGLTSREAAALQGFPDDFIFYGKCQENQIGNAVPPPLAYAIAQELKKYLVQM
jgi:DNA (cytosine-5)-methyltransferase 1